eukprot:Skav227982  [mRNA]  locus=scaffold1165:318530:319318:+ [translate_table: standard]
MRCLAILLAASAGLVTGATGEWNPSAASCDPMDEVAHLQLDGRRGKEAPRPRMHRGGDIVADFQVTGRECCGQGPITVYFVLNSIEEEEEEEEISSRKLQPALLSADSNATARTKRVAEDSVTVLLEKFGAGVGQMGILSSKFFDGSLHIEAGTEAFEGAPMGDFAWQLMISGPRDYAILTPLFFSTAVTHCGQAT